MHSLGQVSAVKERDSSTALVFPSEYLSSRWYAAYTSPRHEKRVAQQMEGRQIHCFLPLYKSVRRWKDRRKQLELPLFPGYVFVHMALKDRLQVLQLPGVVQFVNFNGNRQRSPMLKSKLSVMGWLGTCLRNPIPTSKSGGA